jgi:hypothetical protein
VTSLKRIKANRPLEVKRPGRAFAALCGVTLLVATSADATDPSPNPSGAPSPAPMAEPAFSAGGGETSLAPGDTKRYEAEIVRRASGSPVFLFGLTSGNPPPIGKIILLEHDGAPVMALRVLRADPEKKQFAGKAIKFYGTEKSLKAGETLTVLERGAVERAPIAPPSVTPDAVPATPPPPAEPPPPPADIPPQATEPPPPPATAPAPVAAPPAPTSPTSLAAPKELPKELPHVTPPPLPVPIPTPTPSPSPKKAAAKPAPKAPPAPKIPEPPKVPPPAPPPAPPPVPEIPAPDPGGGPGGFTAPPVPDPSVPETTIEPTSRLEHDTLKSAASAPAPADAPNNEINLDDLEAQSAPKPVPPAEPPADAPPADAPPPPDPNAATELDSSGAGAPQAAEEAPPPDAPPSDTAPPAPAPAAAPDDEGDDNHLGRAVEEIEPLDPLNLGLTFSFGAFKNAVPPNSSNPGYYIGGGIRWSFVFAHMVFAQSAHTQDSFSLEPGIFFYKLVNFLSANSNDEYSIVPMIGTLRYTLMLGETFSLFAYGGMMFNYVAGSVGDGSDAFLNAKASLQSTLPAIGGGVIFRVGPQWDVRADLGTDVVQLGLMLRF